MPRARAQERAPRTVETVNVAAFGDSLMWGQGLRRQDRFTELIRRELPTLFGKPQAALVVDNPRSGAKIRGRGDDRPTFVDRFPSFFGPYERRRFLASADDGPATGLYGEIPAPFPTVRGQVEHLVSAALGRTIDVALVDGGINDIDVLEIIKPDEYSGEFIERFDGEIRAVAYDDVLDLLGRVRRKCPKAVILYFGGFAPLSFQSRTQDIRDALKYAYDNDLAWWFNENIIEITDINDLVHEAIVRSMWMQGRWQYWTRQAVAEANRSASTRGPGVLFVPSGFLGENSLYAGTPFFFQDYLEPTTDPARAERRRRCPRAAQVNDLTVVYSASTLLAQREGGPTTSPAFVQRLVDAIDGPLSLKEALQPYLDSGNQLDLVRANEPLRREIERIQHALIASMGHPNAAGARSYADNAVTRLRQHLEVTEEIARSARPDAPEPPAFGGETVEDKITRYGLRTTGPLLADIGHLDVDSLALRVITAADSDQNFFPNIWLYVTTNANYGRPGSREYLVNFPYRPTLIPQRIGSPVSVPWLHKYYPHFEPGQTNRFTIDTTGRLRLDEIVGCHLVVGIDPLKGRPLVTGSVRRGKVWRPRTVALEVNGRQVASPDLAGREFSFGDTLDLSYPASQSGFTPPRRLPTVTLARVRPVARRPASSRRPDEPVVST